MNQRKKRNKEANRYTSAFITETTLPTSERNNNNNNNIINT